MVSPRKGKTVRVMPPAGDPVRVQTEAVITAVAKDWVLATVERESYHYRAGTELLLQRDALLQIDRQLVAPDAAVARVYPREAQNPRACADAMDRLLGTLTLGDEATPSG